VAPTSGVKSFGIIHSAMAAGSVMAVQTASGG